ncbi:uncharacterized protein [Palaemon carinicauda]|uniref:uncharacterized protein n=1 Tax=Palaemon carinicauda TaxID=392227 RepID=UPI0035B603B8
MWFGPWVLFLNLIMAEANEIVPQIPNGVELGTVSIYNIWEHALRQQKGLAVQRENPNIGTILSPEFFLVINLVPQDAPHPLYSDKYASLRTEFLLDYMIQEPVLPDDARMTAPEGLVVTNLNGKQIKFQKDGEGNLSVNGVSVEGTNPVKDGPVVYNISDFLFNHKERVDVAFQDLLRSDTSHFGHQMNPLMPPPPPGNF